MKFHRKVEEAVDTLDINRVTRRRLLAGTGLVSASLAASALLTACSDDPATAAGAVGNFPKTPTWKFVFVCHVTTNPFFTPTQYGAEDACKLLGVEYQWTGSVNSVVAEMVDATNTAITAQADGIALAVVDKAAFRGAGGPARWTPASRSCRTTPTAPATTRAPTGWPTSDRGCTSRGTHWAGGR